MLRQAVEGCGDSKQSIYDATAKAIGGTLLTEYENSKATDGASKAFTIAKTGWLVGKSPQDVYERRVHDALLEAWREAQ